MLLTEREVKIPVVLKDVGSLLEYFETAILAHLEPNEVPVRFVVTRTDSEFYHCELGVLSGDVDQTVDQSKSIFNFAPRKLENSNTFNAVMLVPTGIGAELGGHAGDAGPTTRLLASICDNLITHPNAVNASDINELTENSLYVEGSVLTQLMMGSVGLQKVRSNRVMLVMDKHVDNKISDYSINAVSAARASLGLECPLVVEMDPPIKMSAEYSSSGSAVGRIENLQRLCKVLERHKSEYDAVALASVINVPEEFHMRYFQSEGNMVNPWGGVEAMLTHAISMLFNVPSAHAPMMESMDILNLNAGIVDPRMSAEAVSCSFLHCVLKGLHRSPRIITDAATFMHPGIISAADISCLIIPDGCVGLPTLAALEQGMPVIAVRENSNRMKNDLTKLSFADGKLFIVDNYLEAAGIMSALKAGVSVPSVRRPFSATKVVPELVEVSAGQEDGSSFDRKLSPQLSKQGVFTKNPSSIGD